MLVQVILADEKKGFNFTKEGRPEENSWHKQEQRKINAWREHTMRLVCRSSSSFTANAICFVLVTLSSNFSRPSSCSVWTAMYYKIKEQTTSNVFSNNSIKWPFIICRWSPITPLLSRPLVLLIASGFISGPNKLSLLEKFGMLNVEAISLTLDLKLASMSLRRFSSFSDLQHCNETHFRQQGCNFIIHLQI